MMTSHSPGLLVSSAPLIHPLSSTKQHPTHAPPLRLLSPIRLCYLFFTFILTLMLSNRAGVLVDACMQTSTSSQTSTTTTCSLKSTCSGEPANSATVIFDLNGSQSPLENGFVGSCPCLASSESSPTVSVYTVNALGSPSVVSTNFAQVTCTTLSQLCVCDVSCNCYAPFGTLATTLSATGYQVLTSPACDAAGCFTYTFISCATANDANSGLANTATGAQVTCAAQFNPATSTADADQVSTGSTSPYIKAAYIGCSGCGAREQAVVSTCSAGTAGTFATG